MVGSFLAWVVLKTANMAPARYMDGEARCRGSVEEVVL